MHAELGFAVPVLYGFLLVLARVSGVLAIAPLPGFGAGPDMMRIVLSLAITLCLFPKWPIAAPLHATIGWLIGAVFAEAALGVAVGVVIGFLIDAVQMGAQVFGLQAGYSYASTIDPTSQADSSVMYVMVQLMAGVMFFSLGLDHDVLRLMGATIDRIPLGGYTANLRSAQALIHLGSDVFVTGMRLGFPIVALLLLVDIALALVGRLQAQLQLLSMAFPLKMLASLVVLAALTALFPAIFSNAADRALAGMRRVLGV
jgi:flagellar biosynthesis protein FliR